ERGAQESGAPAANQAGASPPRRGARLCPASESRRLDRAKRNRSQNSRRIPARGGLRRSNPRRDRRGHRRRRCPDGATDEGFARPIRCPPRWQASKRTRQRSLVEEERVIHELRTVHRLEIRGLLGFLLFDETARFSVAVMTHTRPARLSTNVD